MLAQRSQTLHGWTPTDGNRGPSPFSRRAGMTPLAVAIHQACVNNFIPCCSAGNEGYRDLSEVPLPAGWSGATKFEVDFNYTTCDPNGWTYARDFSYFTDDFLGQNKPSTMVSSIASIRKSRVVEGCDTYCPFFVRYINSQFRARRRRYVRYPVEEESKQRLRYLQQCYLSSSPHAILFTYVD